MEKNFNQLIDIRKFLPSSRDDKILTALYEETFVASNTQEDFFNLPVNEEYAKNKQQKNVAITQKKDD